MPLADQELNSRRERDWESDPLLSIKSDNLDDVPVYTLTHILREFLVSAVDTTLTWEQLKSPQLNSFLIRPLMNKCRDQHSRAIIFCLLTNCAQFTKEAEEDAARAGVNHTRAMACELLACKHLKEFSPRELIDVLTFDFWPLKGNQKHDKQIATRSQRISALELAIKGVCKKFLASPLVVQVLENIWKGNIVFYGASDKDAQLLPHRMRKAASTYDAREASIFKLSRLRVPRYRHWMQTISFAILLGLVIAVLLERSREIMPLEIIMIVYAIGFMLEEVVGLNASGSSLFLSNLWNSFDMLTLLFFIAFFVLRIYGLLFWQGTDMEFFAYDLLAVNTVFLTPRLFSALDHTRQFSQMLIAFQRMAIDLLTSLLFILIFFAGFFLALSLAFARNLYTAPEVAFKLLQLIFGFSPAAWTLLPEINWIGKILLITFMVNTNYLVVTILVSVLSTTFASVISNAHEEHQYLFALNTILAVKSDALFFYQAPLNLIEWLLAPLALVMPRPKWIRLNRYFIKFLHFPMLAAIYMFERFYLRPRAFVPQDLLLARTGSLDTMRGVSGGELHGQRSISAAFFGRKNRRESDAHHKNSSEILEQVFDGTRQPRRQVGYGGTRMDPVGRLGGAGRTNDWVTRLPENVFSPGASDGTPEQQRKISYFDGGPPRRPVVNKRSTTAGLLPQRYPGTTQKPVMQRRIIRRPSLLSGALSDPEEINTPIGSPSSGRGNLATRLTRHIERRPTDDSIVDAQARAHENDSGDDEMEDNAVHEESQDESVHEENNSESGTQTDITATPERTRPAERVNQRQPLVEKALQSTRSDSHSTIYNKRLARPSLSTKKTNSGSIASSVPKTIVSSGRDNDRRRANDTSGEMDKYSSSIATQLAAHAPVEGDILSRIVMNRVDGIENAVRSGHERTHHRMEKLEKALLELMLEMKASRQARAEPNLS